MQKLVFTNGSGQTIDLTSGNFGITNWEGLSGVGLNIQTQQVPFQDGGVFLDALMEQREISVTVAIQDNNDLSLRYELKRQLISALNPKLGEGVLVYTNDYLSRQIKAVPQLPIFENKNSNDAGTLKASVTFSCPSPYWEDVEDTNINVSKNEIILPSINSDIDIKPKFDILNLKENASFELNLNDNILKIENTETKDIIIVNQASGQKEIIAYNINKNKPFVVNRKMKDFIWIEDKSVFVCVFAIPSGQSFKNSVCIISKDFTSFEIVFQTEYQNVHSLFYNESDKVLLFYGGRNERGSTTADNEGGVIYRSTDLRNWQECSITGLSGRSAKIYSIAYSESVGYIGIGITEYNNTSYQERDLIYKSSDSINWEITPYTDRSLFGQNPKTQIKYIEEKNIFVLCGNGDSQTSVIMTTADGETFNNYIYQNLSPKDIVYLKDKIIIPTNTQSIITSENATSWTTENLQSSPSIVGGYGFYNFVKIGDVAYCIFRNQIWQTYDGIKYILSSIQILDNLYAIFSDGNKLFVTDGKIVDAVESSYYIGVVEDYQDSLKVNYLLGANYNTRIYIDKIKYIKEKDVYILSGAGGFCVSKNLKDITQIYFNGDLRVTEILFFNNQILVIGYDYSTSNGIIWGSENGTEWQEIYNSNEKTFNGPSKVLNIKNVGNILVMSSISGTGGTLKSNVYITNDLINYKILSNRMGLSLFDTNGAYLIILSSYMAPYYSGTKEVFTITKNSEGTLTVFSFGQSNINYSAISFGYLSNIQRFIMYIQDGNGVFHFYISLGGDIEEEVDIPDVYSVIIDRESNICLGLGTTNNLYISFDGKKWVEFVYKQRINNAGYLIKNNSFYILTNSVLLITDREGGENIINQMSANSNFNLSLKNDDENILQIKSTYTPSVVMNYKNKYLGV